MPVERSGSKLSINGVDVNIIEACNGLRMVFPLILVSYAFSFGLPLRNSRPFLVLLASPLQRDLLQRAADPADGLDLRLLVAGPGREPSRRAPSSTITATG